MRRFRKHQEQSSWVPRELNFEDEEFSQSSSKARVCRSKQELENKRLYFKAGIQIAVLVIAIIAFSYFMKESSGLKENSEIKIVKEVKTGGIFFWIAKIVTTFIFSKKGLASATDGANILHTCIETNDGQVCKQYPVAECKAKCKQECLSTSLSNVQQCKLGTCYDNVEGKCALGSIKMQCGQAGGTFLDDPRGNHQKCKKGCCFYGGRTQFVTEGECNHIGTILGAEVNFAWTTELQCLQQSEIKIKGACIFGKDPITQKNQCRFLNKEDCLTIRGDFYENTLCSNPDLNTGCEKQKETKCVEGKDEIYWFDSCGNMENIYDADKAKSWNNGMVLSKDESCQLISGTDLAAYRGTCGNCNRVASTKCGSKTSTQRLDDSTQEVVCRDLSCIDENGNKRVNGEAWCVYQGAIGVVDGLRSVDTPGSRHFLRKCIDGEIITEPCADYRTEICVEEKSTGTVVQSFSTAACRQNLGALCIAYNTETDVAERTKKCNENVDCFVKNVYVEGGFMFSACAPKYPIGNDIETGTEMACSFATRTCTAVKVKKISGWKWKSNEGCITEAFAPQMNDFCMSLGDCGAEVNYIGELTENYDVASTPRLSQSYLEMLRGYKNAIAGKVAEPGDVNQFYGAIGLPNELGKGADINDFTKRIDQIAMTSGGTGVSMATSLLVGSSTLGATACAFGAAAAGAAIGFALTHAIIRYAKIGPGISRALYYSLVTAGAVGGAMIGIWISSGATLGAGLAGMLGIIGLVILVIVIVTVIVLKQMHVGDVKIYRVSFTCKPWQPPKGGKDCTKCGTFGFPCSKYACETLGTTCRFLNEGTGLESCEDVAPNDIVAPIIKPWAEKLSEGYAYEEVEDSGVRIKSTATSDGCIPSYTRLQFGLLLDKLGQCRYSNYPNIKYEDMVGSEDPEADFIGGSLTTHYLQNITAILPVPSLEELGYNKFTTQKAEYNLYVKCENANSYASDRDYIVNICIKPGLDIEKPRIDYFEPYTGYVKSDATESSFIVWANEPVNCSWDNEDKEYAAMRNKFECESLPDTHGWKCDAGNVSLPQKDNKFFVRCEDQPFEENVSLRNVNDKSKEVYIKKTEPLIITSATPDGETIVSGLEPTTVTLNVKTSGGLDEAVLCSYSFDGERYPDIFDPFGDAHSKILDALISGDKKIWIKCEDDLGNFAEKTISFRVELDPTPPVVTRIFAKDSALVIKTDEPSTCYISRDKCNFAPANASLMSGSLTYEHSLPVERTVVYYVKCKDKFDNIAGMCNVAAGVY